VSPEYGPEYSPVSSPVTASASAPSDNQSLQQRVDQLEAEVQQLRENATAQNASLSTEALDTSDAAKPDAAKPGAAKPDPLKAADGEYVIGSNLNVKTEFRNGMFLWFSTPNNDFTMHLGAWAQLDNVWWDQSPNLLAPPGARPGPPQGVASGAAAGGIGDLEDGTYFRRIRPFAEGTFWENGEYRMILALENDQFQTIGLDEFWFGGKDLPLVGSLRLGHVKNAMGLEGDMTASSRCMTFMERSAYSEAVESNQNFVTGLWLGDN
jgi:hypothetical protein